LVRKGRLSSPKDKIEDLIKLAIDNRPELKQYEELRLAAKRAIVVAGAGLQPAFAFNGNVFGIGPGLTHMQALYTLGFIVDWKFAGLGTTDMTNIKVARL